MKKCQYCGNNPTNHSFSYAMQTFSIMFSSVDRFILRLHHTYLDEMADSLFHSIVWFLTTIKVWGINTDMKKAPTDRSKVIWEEAERRGYQMEELVIYGKPVEHYRAKVNNKWIYFESLPIPSVLHSHSYTWMDDKWELKNFLRKYKVPVAYGGSVTTVKQAIEIFNKGRKPFIAKPRTGSRGRHTTTHIYTEEQMIHAFKVAQQLCKYVLVEEHLVGSVYRGTYIAGEVVGILRGDPPRIIGDGIHTIKELVALKNRSKHHEVSDVKLTPYIVSFLKRQNLSPSTTLEKGRMVDLLEKIGTSYGGYRAEELPITHPKIIKYIKKAGDVLNAPVIGFDFIIEDITKDPDTQKWGIIEANSLPFIDLHHHPLEGKSINVAGKVWDLWK